MSANHILCLDTTEEESCDFHWTREIQIVMGQPVWTLQLLWGAESSALLLHKRGVSLERMLPATRASLFVFEEGSWRFRGVLSPHQWKGLRCSASKKWLLSIHRMSFVGLIAWETKGPKQSCPQSQSIQQGNECVQVSAVNTLMWRNRASCMWTQRSYPWGWFFFLNGRVFLDSSPWTWTLPSPPSPSQVLGLQVCFPWPALRRRLLFWVTLSMGPLHWHLTKISWGHLKATPLLSTQENFNDLP